MAIKNLKKQSSESIRQYYHSTGLYDSLIYREISPNKNMSPEERIGNLIQKIKKNSIKFNKDPNNIQFSNKNLNSKIMIIGDMPSHSDEKNNSLFSDEAGDLLNKMLQAISLSTDKVYLTNIVHFYTNENKQNYINQKNILKKLTHEHIEIIQPKIIFLLGSLPLEILFGTDYSIAKNRGQWLQYRTKESTIDTLASFHPNFLIKQPNQKKNSWIDLQILEQKIKQLNIK
jgi:uracil-DNA glycosylase